MYVFCYCTQRRLAEFRPIIEDALAETGVDLDTIRNSKSFSYEQNLIADEIHQLAVIGKAVFGETLDGSDEQVAYQLIQEYNNNNPTVLSAINNNPDYAETVKALIDNHRGVNILFSAETEFSQEQVYPLALPLPVFLFLFGGINIIRVPGMIAKIKTKPIKVDVPDTVTYETHDIFRPVKRRLFSEKTPEVLDKERSFYEVFESLDLSAKPRDTHALLEHLLIEEVLPNLFDETKEPMIDYEEVANEARTFLESDKRRLSVKKGSYKTTAEAELMITERLVEMWEQHDAHFYPMEGIDIKETLNYRHSEPIVYWAKTLAHKFINLLEETKTTEEFSIRLRSEIEKVIENRSQQGGSDRNLFVRSEI